MGTSRGNGPNFWRIYGQLLHNDAPLLICRGKGNDFVREEASTISLMTLGGRMPTIGRFLDLNPSGRVKNRKFEEITLKKMREVLTQTQQVGNNNH